MRFDSVLIANRGEIACRIIRTARAMGLRTIAVYTDADANAPHVALSDEAQRIGEGPVGESYLSSDQILQAARETGAGAVHPGYGFLSENAGFANAVQDAGLCFVGPSPDAIETMGDKAKSKRTMLAAGVPCVPGYEGEDQSDETMIAQAHRIGFPVMVKASAGGGGRGMRRVNDAADLQSALAQARSEALNAFGSDHLILEKAILHARHVELQVFADETGACIHLGERDCSVQRRHQKVIEEAPCPVMTPQLRNQMGAAAIAAAQAVGYTGAGTVEFLLDDTGAFYFLEMNTRLQVEHPVTEMVTGLDLVELQFHVAQGAPLPLGQSDVALHGHAMEVRLYAENPYEGFLPATGKISLWSPANIDGLRVDDGIVTGQEVSAFYDPMLAKLIAHGKTRDDARRKLIAGLETSALLGPVTNRSFLIDLLKQPCFAQAQATTSFLDETYPNGPIEQETETGTVAIAAAVLAAHEHARARAASALPDDSLFGLGAQETPLDVEIAGAVFALRVVPQPGGGWIVSDGTWKHRVDLPMSAQSPATFQIDGKRETVQFAFDGPTLHIARGPTSVTLARHQPWLAGKQGAGSGRVQTPMPGLVISVAVAQGDTVQKGDTVAVIEAMKMQHSITADIDGTVTEVALSEGDQVTGGALAVVIEETPE